MSARLRHILAMIPKVFVAGLLIVVMLDLLVGVLLRYVVVRIVPENAQAVNRGDLLFVIRPLK